MTRTITAAGALLAATLVLTGCSSASGIPTISLAAPTTAAAPAPATVSAAPTTTAAAPATVTVSATTTAAAAAPAATVTVHDQPNPADLCPALTAEMRTTLDSIEVFLNTGRKAISDGLAGDSAGTIAETDKIDGENATIHANLADAQAAAGTCTDSAQLERETGYLAIGATAIKSMSAEVSEYTASYPSPPSAAAQAQGDTDYRAFEDAYSRFKASE